MQTRFNIGDVVSFYKRGVRKGIVIDIDIDISTPFSIEKNKDYTKELNTSIGTFFTKDYVTTYITYNVMEPNGNINYDIEERDLYRNPELLVAAIERSLGTLEYCCGSSYLLEDD